MIDPKLEYAMLRRVLDDLVPEAREHAEAGTCPSLPLCPGPYVKERLEQIPGHMVGLVLVALAEIGQEREAMRIQVGLTKDALTAMDLAGERADAAEAERERALDRIDDLERKLATVEAELTNWEDAADVIGPVGYPVD